MNRVMRKLDSAVQLRKMARGLNFWNYEVEGLFYLRSENKGDYQLRDSYSETLSSDMQKAGFLMTRLNY